MILSDPISCCLQDLGPKSLIPCRSGVIKLIIALVSPRYQHQGREPYFPQPVEHGRVLYQIALITVKRAATWSPKRLASVGRYAIWTMEGNHVVASWVSLNVRFEMTALAVIPAKAGIQILFLDPRLRRGDEIKAFAGFNDLRLTDASGWDQ